MEHGDGVAEALAEAADGLRRQGDLGYEDDRAPPTTDRRCAGLQIHLGLAAARGAVQKKMTGARVERGDDALDRHALRRGELGRLRLAGKRVARPRAAELSAPLAIPRSHEGECPGGCRAVVLGQPEREIDEGRWNPVYDRPGHRDRESGRRRHTQLDHNPANRAVAETDRDDVPPAHSVCNLVRERPRERAGSHERVDLRTRHAVERSLECQTSGADGNEDEVGAEPEHETEEDPC